MNMRKMIVSALICGAVFTCGSVMAQDASKKCTKASTECCQKDKKADSKEKKKACTKDKKEACKKTDKKKSCSTTTTCPVKK